MKIEKELENLSMPIVLHRKEKEKEKRESLPNLQRQKYG
jgi:glutamate formiminotransferase